MKAVRQLKTQAGFSLIELMIVVAIIGILASIAVPNFQKFQRRAKQSEGKGYLAGIYSAEQGFRAEWNSYTSDLSCMGFKDTNAAFLATNPGGIAGRGNYIAGFAADGGLLAAPTTCAAGNNTANPIFNAGITTLPALTAGAVTATTFTAQVVGNLNEGNPTDIWTITEAKNVVNVQSGL